MCDKKEFIEAIDDQLCLIDNNLSVALSRGDHHTADICRYSALALLKLYYEIKTRAYDN